MAITEPQQKVLEAFRSGEYKQCRGQLKCGDTEFCAWGVICDVFQRETGRAHWEGKYFRSAEPVISGLCSAPAEVREWIGIDYGAVDLVQLNDFDELSFEEIADILENHWNAQG